MSDDTIARRQHDEVVPREHMQGLWELVEKRVPGGVRTSGGPGGAEAEGAEVAKDESVKSPGGKTLTRFVEFEHGTHRT